MGIEFDVTTESWRDGHMDSNKQKSNKSHKHSPLSSKEMAYERLHNKEAIKSKKMYPFNQNTLQELSFFIHLTDLSRYTEVEICLFIESVSVDLTKVCIY